MGRPIQPVTFSYRTAQVRFLLWTNWQERERKINFHWGMDEFLITYVDSMVVFIPHCVKYDVPGKTGVPDTSLARCVYWVSALRVWSRSVPLRISFPTPRDTTCNKEPVLNTRTQRAVRCHEAGTVWLLLKIWSIFPVFIIVILYSELICCWGSFVWKNRDSEFIVKLQTQELSRWLSDYLECTSRKGRIEDVVSHEVSSKTRRKLNQRISRCWPLGPLLAVAGRT